VVGLRQGRLPRAEEPPINNDLHSRRTGVLGDEGGACVLCFGVGSSTVCRTGCVSGSSCGLIGCTSWFGCHIAEHNVIQPWPESFLTKSKGPPHVHRVSANQLQNPNTLDVANNETLQSSSLINRSCWSYCQGPRLSWVRLIRPLHSNYRAQVCWISSLPCPL
jgi:hypothetical protein